MANFVASEAGNATGLVIYFQNSGHLPAKLSWGPLMTAIVPPIPGFAPQSQHRWIPMTRTRNKKDGSIGEGSGGAVTIGGDSLYVADVMELPKERVSQLSQEARIFQTTAAYEYCDELGTSVCKQFSIYYQGIPYQSFRLLDEMDCPPLLRQPEHRDPNLEYLPACKSLGEQ